MNPTYSILKKSTILCAVAASCAVSAFATNYTGNGNTGFNGAIGQGILSLTSDNTTVTGTLTKGTGGDFFDDFVIYIDSTTGGVTSTAALTDTSDRGRRAISGKNGTFDAPINFTTGFGADFAIALRGEGGSGNLFSLTPNNSFTFVTGVNFFAFGTTNAPDKTTPVDTFSFNLSSIGLVPGLSGQSFSFITTYLNGDDAFRSGESIGNDYTNTTFDGANVGRNIANINAANTFVVPEPSSVVLSIAAGAGLLAFRFRRRRQA